MTTKADVLAAREAYERVAEAYLRERGWSDYEGTCGLGGCHRYWRRDDGHVFRNRDLHDALAIQLRQEPTDDR